MSTVVCPRCATVNPEDAMNCSACRVNLKYALEHPDEVKRTAEVDMQSLPGAHKGKWRCRKCGLAQREPPALNNYCPRCQEPALESRLVDCEAYPAVVDPPETDCYAAQQQTVVVAAPRLDSETLYVVGQGDLLPVVGDGGGFYEVLLPGTGRGFVPRATGIKVAVGLGEVKGPLGYVRQAAKAPAAVVLAQQPSGEWVELYTLKDEDRLPVVEEQENGFKVQLQNGIRGWVHKACVIRTVLATSLPVSAPSGGLASALGTAALFTLAVIVGALAEDSEEARVQRGVDRALRQRGL